MDTLSLRVSLLDGRVVAVNEAHSATVLHLKSNIAKECALRDCLCLTSDVQELADDFPIAELEGMELSCYVWGGPCIEYMGLWADSGDRAFSEGSYRIKYDYEYDVYEPCRNGLTLSQEDFSEDLKAFLQRMQAENVSVAYYAIQNGNEIYYSFGESTSWQRHGKAASLSGTTVPEKSSLSYGLLLEDFRGPTGSRAVLDVKGGAWQNAVYKIQLPAVST
eukprot:TRINITY_DN69481_c0_g1_i1.p1 TRINITY_DN69481_c0_g1~~TRINITY_DN69481_c0_g1_i1.p1  ORF type:complete len:220 (-),score=21.62 TRINITY_DN69481_c0_g1_i1:99-758(-)